MRKLFSLLVLCAVSVSAGAQNYCRVDQEIADVREEVRRRLKGWAKARVARAEARAVDHRVSTFFPRVEKVLEKPASETTLEELEFLESVRASIRSENRRHRRVLASIDQRIEEVRLLDSVELTTDFRAVIPIEAIRPQDDTVVILHGWRKSSGGKSGQNKAVKRAEEIGKAFLKAQES